MDPYSYSLDAYVRDMRFRFYMDMRVRDPRAMAILTTVTDGWSRQLTDPALRWARSWREFWCQLRGIVLHEFWTAQGRPGRSPGCL